MLREAPPGEPDMAGLLARHAELAPPLELLQRCVAAVPQVVDGSRRATEVLFPGGSTELAERVYTGQAAAGYFHRLMAEQAVAAVRRTAIRPARILEVGAGTGASTRFVLQACADAGAEVEYTYTDISPAFVNRGHDAFAARYPFTRFRTLDIERDPVAQGFDAAGYDMVLATNVLHATGRIGDTLRHARGLLRLGGCLLLNEVTRTWNFLTLTFGLTAGWWRFEDQEFRLPHAPLLSPRHWRAALAAAGFGEVRVAGLPGRAADDLEQCLITAQTGPAPARVAEGQVGEREGDEGEAGRAYVRRIFAEVLRYREEDLADRVTFENYGIDSLVSLNIVSRFERDLGPLPATLLFEHLTIEDLAAHLAGGYSLPTAPAPVRAASLVSQRETRMPPAGPSFADIAVVAVTGRYPGAADVDAFWDLLAEGRSGVREIPAERFEWRRYFDPDRRRPQTTYSRWGGFLDEIDLFDAGFFGILPRDAANLDPQERMFLETAWELLERAGYLRRAHQGALDRCLRRHHVRLLRAAGRGGLGAGPRPGPTRRTGRSPTASPTCSTCTDRASRSTPPARPRCSRSTWRARASGAANARWRSPAGST